MVQKHDLTNFEHELDNNSDHLKKIDQKVEISDQTFWPENFFQRGTLLSKKNWLKNHLTNLKHELDNSKHFGGKIDQKSRNFLPKMLTKKNFRERK